MSFDNIVKFIESMAAGQYSIIEGKEAIIVSPDNWIEVSTLLKNESDLDFDYLMCISSYDKGDEKIYGVVYNLFSTSKNHYMEVRVEVEDGQSIPSVVSAYPSRPHFH